jgi:L-ascorbate metabolism protein UlaG (beta-lactamase superfamily)
MSNRGRTFLTDPWFSQRPGYRPGEPAALGVAELLALDRVLISHHHYVIAS